jgi:hypothetical protein
MLSIIFIVLLCFLRDRLFGRRRGSVVLCSRHRVTRLAAITPQRDMRNFDSRLHGAWSEREHLRRQSWLCDPGRPRGSMRCSQPSQDRPQIGIEGILLHGGLLSLSGGTKLGTN